MKKSLRIEDYFFPPENISACATFKVKEFILGFSAAASNYLNNCFLSPQLLILNYRRIAMEEKPER